MKLIKKFLLWFELFLPIGLIVFSAKEVFEYYLFGETMFLFESIHIVYYYVVVIFACLLLIYKIFKTSVKS
jgi:hypothetical protein